MPKYDQYEDYENEFEEYDENDEENDTLPCPYCGELIFEDAEVCPECGNFIVDEDRPSRPNWVLWTAVVLLILILTGYTCLL